MTTALYLSAVAIAASIGSSITGGVQIYQVLLLIVASICAGALVLLTAPGPAETAHALSQAAHGDDQIEEA